MRPDPASRGLQPGSRGIPAGSLGIRIGIRDLHRDLDSLADFTVYCLLFEMGSRTQALLGVLLRFSPL